MRYSVFSGVLPEYSAPEVVEALARHGYDGVEWRVNGEYHFPAATIDKAAARIRALCADSGLAVSSLTSYVPVDDLDGIRRLAAAAAAVDCPRVRAFAGHYDPDRPYLDQRDALRAKLDRIAKALDGSGVKALIEIHFGTIMAGPALAWEVLRDLDPDRIGVILDPANLVIDGGCDMRLALDMLGRFVDFVHVKNTRWERLDDGRWQWRFDDLREGQTDWVETMAALRRAGYDGWLSFENLYRVPVRHKGYVAEALTGSGGEPRDAEARLADEIAYMKALVAGAPGEAPPD